MEKFKHIALICGAACFVLSLFVSLPLLYHVNKHRIRAKEGRVVQFMFYAFFMIFFWPLIILSGLGKDYLRNHTKK